MQSLRLAHIVTAAVVLCTPRLAAAATCTGTASAISPFTGAPAFDPQHVAGYFQVLRVPSSIDVHAYREARAVGGATLNRKLSIKARGDFVQVEAGPTGTTLTVNGVQETPPKVTPGGLQITGSGASTLVVLPNGTSVGATRVTADPAYLDFTIVASTAQVQLASGLCAATPGSISPVPAYEYTALPSDVRVQATALDRAPAGAPIRYRVDVANAGTYALNSIAFGAPPSWGPATSWTCVGLNGATCPAATGTGNPAGPLALPASSTLRYEITALAPNPIVEGTVLARATAPAWTVRAATSVNDANLTWAGHYVDADGDGYGAEPMVFTAPGDDLVSIGGDCDDSDPTVVPGTAACCAQATDCDDGDPCTEDVCTAGACSHSPTCSADAGVDAEQDAGAAESDPGTPPAEPTDAVASSDGCGCRVAGVPSPASSSLLALGLAGLVGLVRVRARRRDGRL